jgi:hypothetical protein
MKSLKKFLRDEKGVSAIIVAVAIVMIFGFAVIAIDLSMVQLAKTQLQNAADAAALAAAIIHFTNPGDKATKEAAATNEAIRIAGLNKAFQDRAQRAVNIQPGDVTFPGGDSVKVITHRTEAAGDPMYLFFLGILNPASDNKADMAAKATATVSLVCGTDCIRPFCPPDKWHDENGDGLFDPDSGDYYDPVLTGYTDDSVGAIVTLKLRNSAHDFKAGWYYAVRFAPINSDDPLCEGGDCYREAIMHCEPSIVRIGDLLMLEKGVMQGPTNQGLEDLISQDPTALWDPVTGTVINSAYPTSPRIIKVCAFDPTVGVGTDIPGLGYVVVSKIMALFIEGHNGSDVVGRFMKLLTEGDIDPDCPGGFLAKVHLVE